MTILLVIGEAFQIMEFGFPHERGPDDINPIWNIGISFQVIVRIVNILIILKLLRVLADFRVRLVLSLAFAFILSRWAYWSSYAAVFL